MKRICRTFTTELIVPATILLSWISVAAFISRIYLVLARIS